MTRAPDGFGFIALEVEIDTEVTLARSSGADGAPDARDADLPFDAAAVAAYEVRLRGLRDAVHAAGAEVVEPWAAADFPPTPLGDR